MHLLLVFFFDLSTDISFVCLCSTELALRLTWICSHFLCCMLSQCFVGKVYSIDTRSGRRGNVLSSPASYVWQTFVFDSPYRVEQRRRYFHGVIIRESDVTQNQVQLILAATYANPLEFHDNEPELTCLLLYFVLLHCSLFYEPPLLEVSVIVLHSLQINLLGMHGFRHNLLSLRAGFEDHNGTVSKVGNFAANLDNLPHFGEIGSKTL